MAPKVCCCGGARSGAPGVDPFRTGETLLLFLSGALSERTLQCAAGGTKHYCALARVGPHVEEGEGHSAGCRRTVGHAVAWPLHQRQSPLSLTGPIRLLMAVCFSRGTA